MTQIYLIWYIVSLIHDHIRFKKNIILVLNKLWCHIIGIGIVQYIYCDTNNHIHQASLSEVGETFLGILSNKEKALYLKIDLCFIFIIAWNKESHNYLSAVSLFKKLMEFDVQKYSCCFNAILRCWNPDQNVC